MLACFGASGSAMGSLPPILIHVLRARIGTPVCLLLFCFSKTKKEENNFNILSYRRKKGSVVQGSSGKRWHHKALLGGRAITLGGYKQSEKAFAQQRAAIRSYKWTANCKYAVNMFQIE